MREKGRGLPGGVVREGKTSSSLFLSFGFFWFFFWLVVVLHEQKSKKEYKKKIKQPRRQEEFYKDKKNGKTETPHRRFEEDLFYVTPYASFLPSPPLLCRRVCFRQVMRGVDARDEKPNQNLNFFFVYSTNSFPIFSPSRRESLRVLGIHHLKKKKDYDLVTHITNQEKGGGGEQKREE